jgi:hypothetical protein
MNRAAVIEQIKAAQETLSKLLAFLESSEADKFVAALYASRKQYRVVCECLNKGATRQLEREAISSFHVAQTLGFSGDFRQWQHLAADSRIIKARRDV